jgi:23S rRNA (guanine2445-N2)-methyltransferase / 23S rRNA (guanine2069-N7)-methyltransferase
VNTLYNGDLKVLLAIVNLDEKNRFVPVGSAGGHGPGSGDREAAPAEPAAPAEDPTAGIPMLENRFRKNHRTLARYLRRENVACYRLYDADIPQHAAAVDVFTDESGTTRALVSEYAPPATVGEDAAAHRFEEIVSAVCRFLDMERDHVYTRTRRPQRPGAQYRRSGGGSSVTAVVAEEDLRFEVNFTDYLDVGLFLDHRLVRKLVRGMAEEKSFLNLFAYTATASVYAAAGGARKTVSVDASNTYLEWAGRNFALNGVAGPHSLIRDECLAFLRGAKETYDLILADPPTFSNSKSRPEDFDVQRDHVELVDAAAALLEPAGEIIFAAHLRSFRLSEEILERYVVSDISEETLPPDFSRSAKQHHVYRIRKEPPRDAQ